MKQTNLFFIAFHNITVKKKFEAKYKKSGSHLVRFITEK